MLGVIVNTIAVLAGSGLGLLLNKGIPKAWADTVIKGIGLCVIYIGISNALEGNNVLIAIISIVIGALIGSWADFNDKLNQFGNKLSDRFSKSSDISIAEGFVTASLLFCVGAMTIVGSLKAGLVNDNEMLFTKSCLDFISSIILASSLGIGVMFSALFVFVFQGAIVLCASFLSPMLSDPVIAEMTCTGGLLIIAIGLNMIKVADIKVMNYILAIFIPIGLLPLYNYLVSLF